MGKEHGLVVSVGVAGFPSGFVGPQTASGLAWCPNKQHDIRKVQVCSFFTTYNMLLTVANLHVGRLVDLINSSMRVQTACSLDDHDFCCRRTTTRINSHESHR